MDNSDTATKMFALYAWPVTAILDINRKDNSKLPDLLFLHREIAGHPGERRTLARVASLFNWPGLRQDVHNYVAACFTCQSTKYVRDKPNGLVQTLPILGMVWEAAMDFIVGLPPSHGCTAIMVVVDGLSKYANFGALKTGFDASKWSKLLLTLWSNFMVFLTGYCRSVILFL